MNVRLSVGAAGAAVFTLGCAERRTGPGVSAGASNSAGRGGGKGAPSAGSETSRFGGSGMFSGGAVAVEGAASVAGPAVGAVGKGSSVATSQAGFAGESGLERENPGSMRSPYGFEATVKATARGGAGALATRGAAAGIRCSMHAPTTTLKMSATALRSVSEAICRDNRRQPNGMPPNLAPVPCITCPRFYQFCSCFYRALL